MAIVEFLVALLMAGSSYAREIEKINFADQLDQSGSKLVLNGVGLRAKRRFGMNFKVYVAGLYLPAKSTQATDLIASGDTKVLRLVFLRSLDAKTLREAWQEGFDKNCKLYCSPAQLPMKAFNDLMVDVDEKSEMRLRFGKDQVDLEISGKEKKTASITNEAFRRSLLAIFIGDNPPTEELKKGLLGL